MDTNRFSEGYAAGTANAWEASMAIEAADEAEAEAADRAKWAWYSNRRHKFVPGWAPHFCDLCGRNLNRHDDAQ